VHAQANGLEPIQKVVGRVRGSPAGVLWRHAPDGLDAEEWLDLLAAGGMVVSLLVACGLGYVPLLALCWILYLTIFLVGQTFLSFQWCVSASHAMSCVCECAPQGCMLCRVFVYKCVGICVHAYVYMHVYVSSSCAHT
jgi:hypothetical protein